MAVRAVKDKLKTSKSLPQVLSSCTLCNLVLGSEIGTRYRYIDDTPLVPLSEAASGGGSSAAAGGAKTRSRASSEYVLYSHGVPAAVNSDEGTSYFGTDILGSVRSVTDKYGAVQSSYDYDAFGSPYLGNLENDVGFGYCGKSYDVGTGLYDYGFRDYSPISARFTTVDPIRDGSNWFSYVVNDPVNYIDPFGLTATDSGSKSSIRSTVNGWIESAKSDLIQTWNDIKGVVSTAIADTKSVVSNFISNAQTNLSKWGAQAKDALQTTSEQIKKNISNSKIIRNIKEQIDSCSNYQAINNTDDVFFAFPENYDNLIKAKLDEDPSYGLIGGSRKKSSDYNSDGAINPSTYQGYKTINGYSVIITKIVDENGEAKYVYTPKNVVPKSHPFLRLFATISFQIELHGNVKEYNNKEAWENSEERNWLETKYYIEAKKLVTPTEESK